MMKTLGEAGGPLITLHLNVERKKECDRKKKKKKEKNNPLWITHQMFSKKIPFQ